MDDKKIYTCQKCGAQFLKWFGQCPECGAWGTIEKSPSNERAFSSVNKELVVKNLSSINKKDINRLSSGFSDLDRALGGGIVPGSLILLSGEPGIGKSTFVLQIAGNLKRQVLYISGEESLEQIKIRADRLGIEQKLIHTSSTQDVSEIIQLTKKLKPSLLIVDSIQSLCSYFSSSKSGSVNQIRTATASLMELAKSMNIPIFIIGHITKDGLIAGPKTLEHLVDVVLCFEGDPYHYFRLLRVNKNRFGPTQEVAVFEMKKQGLKEVKDSSILFLNKGKQRLPGSVVSPVLQGTKVFLTEIQALVNSTPFPYPQRKVKGLNISKIEILIAVLAQRAGIKLSHLDIYLNVLGGLTISDAGADLAICLAIISAVKNKELPQDLVAFGEVGLDGVIHPCHFAGQRIKTAAKAGFKKFIFSSENQKEKIKVKGLDFIRVSQIKEAIKLLF